MTLTEIFVTELAREGGVTRRLLERVPDDRLAWKPHAKSTALGVLANHIAGLPRGIAFLLSESPRELIDFRFPEAASVAEILTNHAESLAFATAKLNEWGDDGLAETFTMKREGKVLFEDSRGNFVRSIMLNHTYHHRGQLTVYLRLLDIPLPSIYGPTADENPFA